MSAERQCEANSIKGKFRAARETTFALMYNLRRLGELRDLLFNPSERKMIADVMRERADEIDPPQLERYRSDGR